MPSRHKILFIFLSLFAMSGLLFAQRDLGTITGTITDPQGAAVPNAKITITEDATGVSTSLQSNETGAFTRPAMKGGTYTVTVEAPGFQKAQQKNVLINPGAPTLENVTLQVGNASQTVEVTAAAPLLQTESPAIGANLNSSQMSQLPLGGQRTFTYLARLSPGILPAENGARDALNGGFSANGVRSTGENNFLLNGVDNNVNVIDFINQTSFVIGPSVEAIGDMTVITNGNNAEYGRAAGGVVNVNLKSGTNELHGVLFEILQNEKLNANRWENNKSGALVPPLKQNQFGGAAGGPIIKNKLFIFGDYQATRIASAGGVIQNLGYGGLVTIPTQAMVGGDFKSLLGPGGANQLYDPTTTTCTSGCTPGTLKAISGQNPVYTRMPFLNNRIPTSMMDPASLKIASLYPATNQPIKQGQFPQNDYFMSTPGKLTTDQGDGRVDYRLNDRNSIFGSISWTNTNKSSVQPFAGILDGGDFNGTSEVDLGRNAQLSYTRLWSSAMVSETRVGFSRLVTARTQANSDIDAFKVAGIGGYNPTGPLNGGIPQIGFQDSSASGRYRTVGGADWLPTKEYNNVWDFIQNVALTKGTHSLKFGAEFRPIQFPFFQVPYPHGEMTFKTNETAFPSTTGTLSNATTGDPVASMLLGAINGGQISTTNFISSTKKAYAFYVQDDWKVSSKLTVNLGLRYELFSPIGEKFSRQSNFVLQDLTLYIPAGPNQDAPLPPNFSVPATINGNPYKALFPQVKVDRGSVDQYLVPWDKVDFGPRVGFAYAVRQKTVVRGAYGIFYGGEENQGGNPNRGESAPFNFSPQLNRPGGVGIFEPNPGFAGGAPTQGVSIGYPPNVFNGFPVSSLQFRELATNFRNPMVQKWNFAIQHELPGQMALEVSYVGNHSSHQLLQPDFNACPNFYTTDSSINCDTLRDQKYGGAFKGIGSISGTATFGWGNYHGMTAKLEKRLSNGLQFVSAYTYGHALANSGTTLSGSNNLFTKDPTNYNTSYTNASWDIRHNFTTAFNYDVPFGRGRRYGANMNRAVNAVVGGWAANGILTLHSGQPFTIRSNGCLGVWGGGTTCSPVLVNGKDPNAAPANGRSPSAWFDTSSFLAPNTAYPGGNLGLQTNYGPPGRTLDFSLFKDFAFTERIGLQFRAEALNLANTPQFNVANVDANRQDGNFGQVTGTNTGSERHIQFALRLHF
jgi:hypothetical protein